MKTNLILLLFLICLVSGVSASAEGTFSNITGDAPLVVQFTDLSSPVPTGWNWSFGDGNYSNSQNPLHIYNYPGQYTVVLATTLGGVTSIATYEGIITVGYLEGSVSADFTYSVSGLNVTFTDTSVCVPHCDSWNWYFGGNNIDTTIRSPVYQFPANGTYTVRLVTGSDVNVGSTIQIITIGSYVYPTIPMPTGSSTDPMWVAPSGSVDLPNSTYLRYWLPSLLAGENTTFSVYGFATSLMKPMVNVFGFWIFLIIWALYIFSVWVRSQDVTMPVIIGILTIGTFGILFPKESLPVIIIMFVICGAIIITKLVKDSI